jgi:23S rRNA pseudouridine2605 synthase
MTTQKKINDSLSKFLAQAGIASRRKVVDLIKSGIVTVNEAIVKEPGFKITNKDSIKVNGQKIHFESKVYIILNKPKNCITTLSDERGRHSVIDIIADQIPQRVYPIGRLDRNTTGLLMLTNDGDLALQLSHPGFEVEKIYHVQLDKQLHRKHMQNLLEGVELEDGLTVVDNAYFLKGKSKKECVVSLHSGKNRIVRRLFEHLGYDIKKLDRIGYAGLTKARLALGQWRHLTQEEIAHLKNK